MLCAPLLARDGWADRFASDRDSKRSGNGAAVRPPQPPEAYKTAAAAAVEVALDVAAETRANPRALVGMSPRQEVWNAVTMATPLLVCLLCWAFPSSPTYRGPRTALIMAGVALHLPASVLYHTLLALRALPDAVDNVPRKVDQSFIHVSCVASVWGLSTDFAYAASCTALNVYFVARLWSPTNTLSERMLNIGIGTLFYGLPSLMHGFYVDFALGSSCFIFGVAAMVIHFGGWGHGLMHVCLGGLAYFCSLYAARLQE